MQPDYPHKHFSDARNAYVFLLMALVIGAPAGEAIFLPHIHVFHIEI